MNEELFREKSLKNIKSPENINDYIRVTNPGVWIILAAVIVLLIGAFVWGTFGYIESYEEGTATVINGEATLISGDSEIAMGMDFYIGETRTKVERIRFDENNLGSMYISANVDLPDGLYDSKIIIERVKPLSLILK